jgi:hypothetical protein
LFLFSPSDVVIPRMKVTCPWAKLIVMLRSPTERAYSQYQMCCDPTGTPEQLRVRGESSYKSKTFMQVKHALWGRLSAVSGLENGLRFLTLPCPVFTFMPFPYHFVL